jgi:RNA-binding protein YlmH
MLPKAELLKGIENREEVSQVLDKAEQALKTWEIALTDFLSPPILIEVQPLLNRLTEVEMMSWGGYALGNILF